MNGQCDPYATVTLTGPGRLVLSRLFWFRMISLLSKITGTHPKCVPAFNPIQSILFNVDEVRRTPLFGDAPGD